MISQRRFMLSTGLSNGIKQRATRRRIVSSLLIGIGLAVILTLIEAGILLLLNPYNVLSKMPDRFTALTGLLAHAPATMLLPLFELLAATGLAFLAIKPIELIGYLRAARRAQEEYSQLYTPLKALTNLRTSTATYQQNNTAVPTVIMQEEQVSILDLVRGQDSHLLILGLPGAGKTIALRVYQYEAAQNPCKLVLQHGRIPIYVPMKNYSLYLKDREQLQAKSVGATLEVDQEQKEDTYRVSILDFLYSSDLPGLQHLRNYLQDLSDRGQLLLLCDGLNEVDNNYISRVSTELTHWMKGTQNRLVMTCREVDYREQREFEQLVDEGHASCAVIYPLQPEQINEFVERYVERQDKHWKHTAGQIIQVIDRSRLRYHCSNPMLLFTLMGIIDKIGIERGRQIDTRGRLLREYIKQIIGYEQRQPRWSQEKLTEQEVIRFLSEVACAARWANDRNAIQLRVATSATADEEKHKQTSFAELADELQYWLDEHPAQGPCENEEEGEYQAYENLAQLLQFALSAALIEISSGGVLSFRHELIAEYFVAEYFFTSSKAGQRTMQPVREELLENVGRWSEPVAIWAGLLDDPLSLAENFGQVGLDNPAYVLQALTLGLLCIGVLWTPPQASIQRTVTLPTSIEEALSIAVRNKAAREELARVFTRCAEEGGQEVYRSLLPLIMIDGIDELLTLLDQNIVPDLLFTHLENTIDNVAYEPQVKRLTRVLGRFGGSVVERASQLSLPATGKSPRLRAAAINILGGTKDARAVEPLINRLSDTDNFIAERATNALIRLGADLTLSAVLDILRKDRLIASSGQLMRPDGNDQAVPAEGLEELKRHTISPLETRIHYAALLILGRFLDEHDIWHQVPITQYKRVIDAIVPVLTSNYQNEPEVQNKAIEILVSQGRNTTEAGTRDNRTEYVIKSLVNYLPTQNEVAARNVIQALQKIGTPAIPHVLNLLNQPADATRLRVIEIVKEVRDARALPRLLNLLDTPTPTIQQQVADALMRYAPESIYGLIDLILQTQNEATAKRAMTILGNIGHAAVEPINQVLFNIVPGRTALLVQVLAQINDPECVSALITLLQTPQIEPFLAITIVRTLGQFPQQRIVAPLLTVLSSTNPQLYEEAIDALSQLGPIALGGLVATLNAEEDVLTTQRAKRAILGMKPFPGEQLIELLGASSERQAQEIMTIFKVQGAEAALVLARHLQHPDEPIRDYIQQTLSEMPGAIVVPALLEALYQPALRNSASGFLLRYPDAAIAPLVELLGERERGEIAAQILPQFGPRILRPLISGLNDQRSIARELAQRIIVTLVRQRQNEQNVLHAIVQLFYPELPRQAHDVLLRVLTSDLADISVPALLEGLEDAYLVDDVADAFVLLAHKPSQQQNILARLIEALYVEERRRGAATALIRIGAPAVLAVGNLITSETPAIAKISREILREIGAPALAFIWNAQSDRSNPARREAALEIFHDMPTEVVKDELITRLTNNKTEDIGMAVSLLLDRVHDEAVQHYADQSMLQVLVEYVQTHGVEETNLRVISLLLLLGDHGILDQLVQALDEYSQHRRQLIHALLLLGEQAQETLLNIFQMAGTSPELRAEIAAILGMTSAPEIIAAYAQNLSQYGLASDRNSIEAPEELSIALHSLGGLLAGGVWNLRTLQELYQSSPEGSPGHELFGMLLGKRYEPQIARLQGDLQSERDSNKQAIKTLTERIMLDQERIQELEQELEQIQREHGSRGDELQQATQTIQELRRNLSLINNERDEHSTIMQQLEQEREMLQAELEQREQEILILNNRLSRTIEEKELLADHNERLIQQLHHPRTHP
jgi:HEAT repeat protein